MTTTYTYAPDNACAAAQDCGLFGAYHAEFDVVYLKSLEAWLCSVYNSGFDSHLDWSSEDDVSYALAYAQCYNGCNLS